MKGLRIGLGLGIEIIWDRYSEECIIIFVAEYLEVISVTLQNFTKK